MKRKDILSEDHAYQSEGIEVSTRKLSDFHEIQYRSSLQKVVNTRLSFLTISTLTIILYLTAF